MGRSSDMGKAKQPRRVRLGREVKQTVVRGEEIDICEVAYRHRREITVAQHGAFRLSCGAACVEDPCEVVGFATDHSGGLGARQFTPLPIAQHDEAFLSVERFSQRARHVSRR